MPKTKKQINLKVRIPQIILDARNADPKLIKDLAEGLESLDARFRVLGVHIDNVALPYAFSVEEAMEEAHLWVILGDKVPNEFSMLAERGIVPVLKRGLNSKFENYNPIEEKGNAFLFAKSDPWHVYGTLVRAIENFNFVYDWGNLRSEVQSLGSFHSV